MYCNNSGAGVSVASESSPKDPSSNTGPADTMSPTSPTSPTSRTKVRRLPERGRYDKETIESILDEGFVCHLGLADNKSVRVVPTAYARVGDVLYLHGAAGNAALKAAQGAEVCVTVTLVDGLVLARAAFHHSINFRSVTIYGNATEVTDKDEKRRALDAVVEHIVPGRGADARGPNDSEVRATRVIRVPIAEASAKVRTGGPKDDAEDMDLPIWAGQVPLHTVAEPPIADDGLPAGVDVPFYACNYARPAVANVSNS
jgi:nitroimidazol reductase NimA-like FMN-containing flavoprotein (pyridoxamine 5'-phosphate oxidase superfamily)